MIENRKLIRSDGINDQPACYTIMRESKFFNETDVKKEMNLTCPFCRETFSYRVRWRQRLKKKHLPRMVSSEDHQRFVKARSYLIRLDDTVCCRNSHCRKQFEITSFQTVVFLDFETTVSTSPQKENQLPERMTKKGIAPFKSSIWQFWSLLWHYLLDPWVPDNLRIGVCLLSIPFKRRALSIKTQLFYIVFSWRYWRVWITLGVNDSKPHDLD